MKPSELKRVATLAASILTNNGTMRASPVLSNVTKQRLIEECGKPFLRLVKSMSSRQHVSYKTFMCVAKGIVCLNCTERLPDHRGNCRSLCLKCIQSGIDPVSYKTNITKITCQSRYGVDNPFQSEKFKKKGRATNLKLYGSENPGGSTSTLRDSMNAKLKLSGKSRDIARRSTMLRKYGASHWTHVPELKNKFKRSMELKHGLGITNVMHVDTYREAHASRMKELKDQGFWLEVYDTVKGTMRKRYGIDNIFEDVNFIKSALLKSTGYEFPLQNPKSRKKFVQTSISRYGSTHPMHDPVIFQRCMENHRTINYSVIGTYEVFFLSRLLTKFKPKDILTGFDVQPIKTSSFRRYYPDFYIKSRDQYVEIKSTYTLMGTEKNEWSWWKRNVQKAKECAGLGINLTWIIPVPTKKKYVILPKTWHTLSRKKLDKLIKKLFSEAESVSVVSPDQFQAHLLYRVGTQA